MAVLTKCMHGLIVSKNNMFCCGCYCLTKVHSAQGIHVIQMQIDNMTGYATMNE